MNFKAFSVAILISALCVPYMLPASGLAEGLIQLRPLNTGSGASASSTSTVQPWQPTTTSSGRIDTSAYDNMNTSTGYSSSNTSTSAPYRTGVSAVAGKQYLTVRLNDRVSSQDIKVGDTITATLESPVMSGSSIIAPAGSEVLGSVIDVSSAKRAGVHGQVDLRFYTIVKPTGERVAIDAIVVTKNGDSIIRSNNYVVDAARGVGIAAAGTAGGAVVGTATGAVFGAAGSGAALGTAIGATAGVGYALWRKGKAVELPKGTLIQLQTLDAQTAQARPI